MMEFHHTKYLELDGFDAGFYVNRSEHTLIHRNGFKKVGKKISDFAHDRLRARKPIEIVEKKIPSCCFTKLAWRNYISSEKYWLWYWDGFKVG